MEKNIRNEKRSSGNEQRITRIHKRFNPKRDLVVGTDGIPFLEFFKMKIEELF